MGCNARETNNICTSLWMTGISNLTVCTCYRNVSFQYLRCTGLFLYAKWCLERATEITPTRSRTLYTIYACTRCCRSSCGLSVINRPSIQRLRFASPCFFFFKYSYFVSFVDKPHKPRHEKSTVNLHCVYLKDLSCHVTCNTRVC